MPVYISQWIGFLCCSTFRFVPAFIALFSLLVWFLSHALIRANRVLCDFPRAYECEEVFELVCAVVRLCFSCSWCAPLTGIAPNITAGPSDSTVIDGMSVILHCETSGAPRPAITWQKGEEHILQSLHSRITKEHLQSVSSQAAVHLSASLFLCLFFSPLYCTILLQCRLHILNCADVISQENDCVIWHRLQLCKCVFYCTMLSLVAATFLNSQTTH